MHVEMSQALRVLAHELRSPAGVAQGYVRMLLDGRLTDPSEQRHALEQVRDVIGRIGALSRQASDAASWLERTDAGRQRLAARVLIDDVLSTLPPGASLTGPSWPVDVVADIGTLDREALATALSAVVAAVARERPKAVTAIRVDVVDDATALELLAGPEEVLASLHHAVAGGRATPLAVERGGLGLTLVNAAFVLERHRATLWTVDNRRDACGIRIPLEA